MLQVLLWLLLPLAKSISIINKTNTCCVLSVNKSLPRYQDDPMADQTTPPPAQSQKRQRCKYYLCYHPHHPLFLFLSFVLLVETKLAKLGDLGEVHPDVIYLSPDIQSDYHHLITPTTKSGLTIDSFQRKDFRYSLLPALHDLPTSYPRESKGAWHRFWHLAIPHQAATVIWRLSHHRLYSRE